MPQKNKVIIELVKGTISEYVIKDNMGITIGRFAVIEKDNKNKNSTIRLKFYRTDNYLLFSEVIELMLNGIFKDKDIYKLNIITAEDTNIGVFLSKGFILEGILTDNVFENGVHKSEIAFGITVNEYNIHSNIVQVQLKGSNIILKNLTPEYSCDLLDYYLRNKEYLEPFEPARDKSFYTLEGQKEILLEGYKQFIDGTSLDFGIFKDNKLIGKIKLSNIVFGVLRNAFLGYSIDENYQGKGFMREAVNLVLDYAFKEMGLHRIEASTLINNEKSQRVLKNCGFKELGINEEYLYINGQWSDHIIFYRINTEM
ncbi:GNAT family N-acetyltransferase [Clostridium fallax]|uniref:Ribosomal-protein-alanine N-acetyltransferase n=1 Tax=Clostridium fallax TaxID=1533 RepID=A0A1M4W658_9CLOT|nr:GNAT family protein [Clostridium fallax]SHE76625.1 ribosomal-protein-alanine N-acetyltransferase [Clostridium fallax]SQB22899.1 GNAT family acetyltransferase [Clostridium fallax]